MNKIKYEPGFGVFTEFEVEGMPKELRSAEIILKAGEVPRINGVLVADGMDLDISGDMEKFVLIAGFKISADDYNKRILPILKEIGEF